MATVTMGMVAVKFDGCVHHDATGRLEQRTPSRQNCQRSS